MSEHCGTLVSRRVTWSPKETKDLISLIGKHDVRAGKITNAEAYQQVSEQMSTLGHKKTPDQCKIKWKHLKNFYYEARKKTSEQAKFTVCPFYNEIRDAIGSPPSSPHVRWNHKQEFKRKLAPAQIKLWTSDERKKQKLEEPIKKLKPDTNGNIKTESRFNQKSPMTVQISSSVTLSPCPPVDLDQSLDSTSSNFGKRSHQSFIGENKIFSDCEPTVILEQIDNHGSHPATIASTHYFQAFDKNEYSSLPVLSPTIHSSRNYSTYTPEVCIKWNSYQFNMQNTLPYLLDCDKYVDVTLACEGRFLKCHKLILSACSIYFDELLSQTTHQYPIIFMKDMKFWQIQAIVQFMYRGEVNIAQERLPSLLAAAESLRVKGLAAPTNPKSAFDKIDEEMHYFDYDAKQTKLRLPVKRGRKRKFQFELESQHENFKCENEERCDTNASIVKENTSNLRNVDEDEYFSNTNKSTKSRTNESKSCVTTIILPDHNYQQHTACKWSECSQQVEQNFDKNDERATENLTEEKILENKNHQDHIYSKPRKETNQLNCDNSVNPGEEDVGIHDNTIFYSYLQIDDNSPNKT